MFHFLHHKNGILAFGSWEFNAARSWTRVKNEKHISEIKLAFYFKLETVLWVCVKCSGNKMSLSALCILVSRYCVKVKYKGSFLKSLATFLKLF